MTNTQSTPTRPTEIDGSEIVLHRPIGNGWVVITVSATEAERRRIFPDAQGNEYAIGIVTHKEAQREQDAIAYARMTEVTYAHGWGRALDEFDSRHN